MTDPAVQSLTSVTNQRSPRQSTGVPDQQPFEIVIGYRSTPNESLSNGGAEDQPAT